MTAPSAVPPLYHDRHAPAHAVRGMNASTCAPSLATARADGAIAAMPSVWHLWMMRVMYAAMCSVSVKTLPWPMGALGPRKAGVGVVSVEMGEGGGGQAALTEVIRHPLHAARHVCARPAAAAAAAAAAATRPDVLQIDAAAADEWEARAERDIEPRGADEGVERYRLAGRELDAGGHDAGDGVRHDARLLVRQGGEVAGVGDEAAAADGEGGDEGFAQPGVVVEGGGHVGFEFGEGEGLDGGVFEVLVGGLVRWCGDEGRGWFGGTYDGEVVVYFLLYGVDEFLVEGWVGFEFVDLLGSEVCVLVQLNLVQDLGSLGCCQHL